MEDAVLATPDPETPTRCDCTMPNKAEFRDQARVIKAIANEARLMMVWRLDQGECSAGALAALVGLDPSTVSKHLAVLRAAGIVDDRRDGTTVYYRLLTPCVLAALRCASRVVAQNKGNVPAPG